MTLKTLFVMKTGTPVDGVAPKLPYQFSAQENTEDGTTQYIVDIVMPIGGTQSALFRYPKEGEKVLVGIEENKSYLMGYLAEEKDSENTSKDDIFTGQNNSLIKPDEFAGQFFRYKGPQDSPLETEEQKDSFSEVGFYHETTQWKPKDANEGDPCPKVTAMKIKSSGDMHLDTQNHQRNKAKRFELLVDCEGAKDYTKETEDYSKEDYAFGDMKGDDPQLYAGDAHIRAKNRIVIKAGDEIQLEVGRSVIVINDTGVSIVSRKTKSRDSNTWDSKLAVCAKDGIGMFGNWLNLKGGYGFDLSEGFGGSVNSKLGVGRVEGLDVRLSTINTINYSQLAASNTGDFSANCVDNKGSGQGSLSKESRIGGGALGNLTTNSLKAYGDWGDNARSLLLHLEMLLFSHALVGIELEQTVPKEELDDLYQALACSEYDLIKECVNSLAQSCPEAAIFETVVHLHRNAKLELNSNTIMKYNIENTQAETAQGGSAKKSVVNKIGIDAKQFSQNLYEFASQEDIDDGLRRL